MTGTRRIVVDASAVVPTLLEETHTEQARSALASADELLAPELVYYEVTSALAVAAWNDNISPEEGQEKQEIARRLPIITVPARDLDVAAFALSMKLRHSSYDCFYLALAIAEDCQLVTADRQLAQVAEEVGLGDYVQLLG